jgi:hypothetical protein
VLSSSFTKFPVTTVGILLEVGGSNVLSIRCWPVHRQRLIVEIIKRSNACGIDRIGNWTHSNGSGNLSVLAAIALAK